MDKCDECKHDFRSKTINLKCPECNAMTYTIELENVLSSTDDNQLIFRCTLCGKTDYINIYDHGFARIKQIWTQEK